MPSYSRAHIPLRSVLVCVALALLTTGVHLAVLLQWATAKRPAIQRYHAFINHDSYWFLNIIQRGYQSPVPPSPRKAMEISNVAFFPAFPFWAKFVIKTLGVSPKTGLLIASQLGTWGFWTYLFLLLQRWGVPLRVAALGTALIIAHPAAFYLIAGYSESLFLMMLLGFMYWARSTSRAAPVLAAVHGCCMTATRIAGVPAAMFPLVRKWLDLWQENRARLRADVAAQNPASQKSRIVPSRSALFFQGLRLPPFFADADFRALRTAAIVSATALLGAVSFFAYCHFRFGHWDFYMMTQEAGWRVHADYLAIFRPSAYVRVWPDIQVPWQLGQFSVTATMLAFFLMIWWEIRAARLRPTRWRERAGLYFVGFALFYIAVSGVYSVRLESMIRYQFCTHVFLVLAAVHAFGDVDPQHTFTRRLLAGAAAASVVLGFYIQLQYAGIFSRGGWVAFL